MKYFSSTSQMSYAMMLKTGVSQTPESPVHRKTQVEDLRTSLQP